MYAAEAIFGIELAEGSGSTEVMRNPIWGRSFKMLSNDGFVEISGVKAYAKGAVRLQGVGQGRYPVSQSSDWGNDSEGNHVV